MGHKPKPKLKPDDPEQSKRFIETAKEVGADDDAKALDHAFKKIAQQKSDRPPTKRNP
jgi:hypothetical protein